MVVISQYIQILNISLCCKPKTNMSIIPQLKKFKNYLFQRLFLTYGIKINSLAWHNLHYLS